MGQLHRLEPCRRCRRVFVARAGEHLCPDCRQEMRRQAGRRLRHPASGWQATLAFAVGALGLALLAGALQPAWTGWAAWIGGAAAVVYIARQS